MALALVVLLTGCGEAAPSPTSSAPTVGGPGTTAGSEAVTTSVPASVTSSVPVSSPSTQAATDAAPTALTAADLGDIASCGDLHERVLGWLDGAAAYARQVHPDGEALDMIIEAALEGEVPEGMVTLEDMWLAAPYGGLGGQAVARRYDELGCHPDDEFPALLDWAGLSGDTDISASNDDLVDRFMQRVEADGAGGYVALAFVRRLIEGGELSDSRLMVGLSDIAQAMNTYRGDHGRYAEDLEQLRPYLDDPSIPDWDAVEDPVIIITKATADAYCVHGADNGSAVVESHDGIPRNRTPGTPSCPNTFPDIDDR